ncbi:acyltransferase [Plectonema radiosum NIES-515]|uniref:Acyltransferase n=1 Tax=Plectonema radiosum NIES-515 TaxID=2986073 RepID=A0ABT3B5C3_9CYAN|nr:acyltransferase [Plectonema radiosum]MCV3216575.1 acyltransferase [Plectonema radiosum NIES-515]
MNQLIERPISQRLHLHYLDGLRGIASLYVVFVHVEPSRGENLPRLWSLFENLLRYGAFSVVIFIVLSGYVLMLPVVRSQNGHISGSLIDYIKRRSRRILPPYYAALFLSLLLAVTIFTLEKFTDFQWNKVAGEGPFYPNFSFIDVLSHLLLIHNLSHSTYLTINPPMWSVATEWQLYFLFPLLLLPLWRRFSLLSVVIAAFVIGITPFYLLNGFSMSSSSWFIGLFALGMAAADIGFSQKPELIAIRNSLRWDLLAIVFTVITFLTEWKQLGLDIWIGQSFCGLAAVCLFIYCTKLRIESKDVPYFIRLLEHPWVVALGGFSYSLYLIHGPVLVLVRYFLFYLPISPSMFAATCYLVGVGMSLLIAYWFYLVFERPFMSSFLKKRFR